MYEGCGTEMFMLERMGFQGISFGGGDSIFGQAIVNMM